MRIESGIRRTARASRRAAKRAYRRFVGENPLDPVRAWPGTAGECERALRVLHVGDCGVRRMDAGHDLFGEPGYPVAAARQLKRHGIGIEFQHYFCVSFEKLPGVERLREVVELSGAPDLVLIQIGSAYTRMIILPDSPRVHQLRDELSRRLPGLVEPFYRVLRPSLRAFGRLSADYRGRERLAQFIAAVHGEFPHAHVVLVSPFRRSPGFARGEVVAERIDADLLALAQAPGVSVFDANDTLGRDPALRCVTGYNLNGRGSELVGADLADWIREHVDTESAERPESVARM